MDYNWFTRKRLKCYVKVLGNIAVEQLQKFDVELDETLYVPLSGSKHGDSVPFDTLPYPRVRSSSHQGQPTIAEITVFASQQFVNGLQIRYSDDSMSSTLGFGGPKAAKHTLNLRGATK